MVGARRQGVSERILTAAWFAIIFATSTCCASTARDDLLVYNRVPKTGSSTLQYLFDVLSTANNFTAEHLIFPPMFNGSFSHWRPTRDQQLAYYEYYSGRPTVYNSKVVADFHFVYTNFSEQGFARPLLMNTLRHPLKRLTSHYFYVRHGELAESDRQNTVQHFGDHSLEECLDLYRKCNCSGACLGREWHECLQGACEDLFFGFDLQFWWFCPWSDDQCWSRDRQSLEKAKYVLEHEYHMFGLLERLEQSVELFEHMLPAYFQGATVAFKSLPIKNANSRKPRVLRSTAASLREIIALDIEFYEFAERLFEARYAQMLREKQPR